jgi:hypothetical protein
MSVNINHQLEQVNNLKITAVGTGATVGSAGIVTYYGDGSNITGISTLNIVNYSAGGGGGGGDAATLDGLDSLQFLRSDFADQKTVGDLRFNNNIGITFGGSDNSRLFHDGTDLSLDLTAYVTDFKIRDGTTERYTFTKAGQLSLVDVNASGIVTATSFVKTGGTSSQYLMADGSVSTGGGGGGGIGTATTRSVNSYTATASQTLFPPSGTVPYTVGYIDVYLNGSKLDSSEFTASNGTTVTLTTGASLNDIVELVAYENVSINDIVVINDTSPKLGGDLDVNNHDITGTGNMNITGIATANGGQLQTESDVIALAIALG